LVVIYKPEKIYKLKIKKKLRATSIYFPKESFLSIL
jgi:hypothetical protein